MIETASLYSALAAPSRDPNISVRMLRILLHIHLGGKVTNLRSIATEMQMPPPSLCRSLDMLGTMHLVKRIRDDNDRRVMSIHLTEEGLAYVKELCA